MVSFHRAIALAAVGILSSVGLAACNTTPQATSSAPTATTVAVEASPSGFEGLKQVITTTQADVEAGDFAKAKADFGQIEDFWRPVEDGVKDTSADTYETIETNMDAVSEGLDAETPNADELLAALTALATAVDSVAP